MTRAIVVAMIVSLSSLAVAAVEDDLRDGDKFFEDGDWKRASAAYDRAIGEAPGQVAAEAYGKRAAIFIIVKDFKGGLAFVAKAKQRSSVLASAPAVLEQEALMLWEVDRKDDAVKIALQVVKLRPETFTNQKLLGEYYAARDPVLAAAAFEAYLAHRPAELEAGDVLPRIRLGFAYLANARAVLGDADEVHAEQLYGKAVDQFEYVARKLGKKPNAQVNADNGLCAAYAGLGKWDQATTVCERVIANPKRIDATGSVWFNLATAYLARKQTKKARSAATEFLRLRKTEARGFIVVGDTYFADRDWSNALDYFLRAEKLVKPADARTKVALSIRLGKTYRRLPAPASGRNSNLDLAIAKLATAFGGNPTNLELATELGTAYLEAKQDAKATALTDTLLASARSPGDPAILVIAGKALFNQHKLKEARQRFEAAQLQKPADIQIQHALVETINEQAFDADAKPAQMLLEQALAIDAASPVTLTNLAILAVERGDCDAAQRELARLANVRGTDAVVTARLVARSHLCPAKPDVKRAAEAYAIAEKEAKAANAQLALAEIYTEWAPLLWDVDLGGAVDKLELAVQVGGGDPEVGPAAKRNLALALYRRGWKQMRDGKPAEATADFQRATRDPSVLRGTEPLAFDFSYALALLDGNRAGDAAKLFKSLAAKGYQSVYLKGPYAKVGSAFFAAYASYRTATGAARQQACTELDKLAGELGGRSKELVASCWELVAYDDWKAGNPSPAQKALALADKSASVEQKRRIGLDRAALALGKDKLAALEALGGNPPESLVDLGIVYDLLGEPKQAFDAWSRAKAKGATTRDLQKWIDAKKRIYGY